MKNPALLVCDQFRAYLTEATKRADEELNTQLAVIPGVHTSQLQPLDVPINEAITEFMREERTKWMEAPGHDLTPIRRMKRPATPQVCEWVNIS
jgi:hypothetical protein